MEGEKRIEEEEERRERRKFDIREQKRIVEGEKRIEEEGERRERREFDTFIEIVSPNTPNWKNKSFKLIYEWEIICRKIGVVAYLISYTTLSSSSE